MTTSKQVQEWQAKRIERHQCIRCGNPAKIKLKSQYLNEIFYFRRCNNCMDKDRIERRKRYYKGVNRERNND